MRWVSASDSTSPNVNELLTGKTELPSAEICSTTHRFSQDVKSSETVHRGGRSDLVEVLRVEHRHEVELVALRRSSKQRHSVLKRHARRRRRRRISGSGRGGLVVVALQENSAGADGRRLQRRLAELAAVVAASDEAGDGHQYAERRQTDCRPRQHVDRQTPHQRPSVRAVMRGDVGTVHDDEATAAGDDVKPTDERRLTHVDAERVAGFGRQMGRRERPHVRLHGHLTYRRHRRRVQISPFLAVSHAIFARRVQAAPGEGHRRRAHSQEDERRARRLHVHVNASTVAMVTAVAGHARVVAMVTNGNGADHQRAVANGNLATSNVVTIRMLPVHRVGNICYFQQIWQKRQRRGTGRTLIGSHV